jgi:hypothetical protein
VKPLDSNGGALEHLPIEDPALAVRAIPGAIPGNAEGDELDEEAPRARSEVVAAPQNVSFVLPSALSRVSQVVPLGTADDVGHAAAEDGFEESERVDGAARVEGAAANRVEGDDWGDPSLGETDRVAAAGENADPSADRAAALTPEPAVANGVAASDIAPRNALWEGPRYPQAIALRAARKPEFGATMHGTGFGLDEDEEETTVDAGAALTEEEQDALMRRIHSAMAETLPAGTPSPEPVQLREASPVPPQEARSMFKQTMLLGLPQLQAVRGAAPAVASSASGASASNASEQEAPAAVMASVVRVVGPPTQPPPRRSRRSGPAPSLEGSEPDHEAFVLSQPIGPADALRRASRVPMSDVPTPRITRDSITGDSISRSSIPGVILPPPPQPQDYEPAPPSMPMRPSLPLRATIEPPSSLSRTRPPMSRAGQVPDEANEDGDLPMSDPFAGFVAPPPSVAQRWLVVVVVALAVVGLCSLAAIAFGFLGKTGW